MFLTGYVFNAQKKEEFSEGIGGVAEKYLFGVGVVFFSTASRGVCR
jgi:hypothetical protein